MMSVPCEATGPGCQSLDHGSSRSHVRTRALVIALVIAFLIMVIEAVGFVWTGGSLVLLSDAGHMLADVGSIGLALFAAWIARRPASAARTYGYFRAEILAALVNGAALFAITFWLVYEAWERVAHPETSPHLDARTMIEFGAVTFVGNCICAWVLHRAMPHAHGHDHDHAHDHDEHGHHDHKHEAEEHEHHDHDHHHDLNLRGALLHVIGDVLASLGTIVAGFVIWQWGFKSADAIAAALLSVLILLSAWGLVVRSVDVLLESAPRHLDVTAFEAALSRVGGIKGVHDLHVWTITSGLHAMSCHVRIADGSDPQRVLADLTALIRDRFGISHTTIQIEVEAKT